MKKALNFDFFWGNFDHGNIFSKGDVFFANSRLLFGVRGKSRVLFTLYWSGFDISGLNGSLRDRYEV